MSEMKLALVCGVPTSITYTNYAGVKAQRMIQPIKLWFGSNQWHPEPQWLLEALDVEKGCVRDFALAGIEIP